MAISLEQLTRAAGPENLEVTFQLAPEVRRRSAQLHTVLEASSEAGKYRRQEQFQQDARNLDESAHRRGAIPMPSERYAAELAAQADTLATNPTQRSHILSLISDHYPDLVKQIPVIPNRTPNQAA